MSLKSPRGQWVNSLAPGSAIWHSGTSHYLSECLPRSMTPVGHNGLSHFFLQALSMGSVSAVNASAVLVSREVPVNAPYRRNLVWPKMGWVFHDLCLCLFFIPLDLQATYHRMQSSLVVMMAWCQTRTKPLPESMIYHLWDSQEQIDGLVQDCGNFSGLAIELLQSCTVPLKYKLWCS